MLSFADLIAPLSPEAFFRDYYGRRPVHIRGDADMARRAVGWPRFNELLAHSPCWTEANLKLILDSRPIGAEHYCDLVQTPEGPRLQATPAKVQIFLNLGASLVADGIQRVSGELTEIAQALNGELSGLVGANAYCSFGGVQAFATHYNSHEVFAIHMEGEKTWRIYEGRADNPIGDTPTGPDAQARIDAARGPMALEVAMLPGDLLYIPRGQYHDALASSDASLHVTFSVEPHTARILFRLLEKEALQESAFRGYLPDAGAGGGAPLRQHLQALAGRVAALMTSPAFETEVANAQRALSSDVSPYALPARRPVKFYVPIVHTTVIERNDEGYALVANGTSLPLGPAHEAIAWALSRPAFSFEETAARFPHVPSTALKALLERLLAVRIVAPSA